MRSILKKISIIVLCLVIPLFSIGCVHDELHELVITIGMGIDKDLMNPENVKLIAQIVKSDELRSGSQSNGGESKGYFNTEISGENSFDAIRKFTQIIDSRLYLAHTVVFVIGNEAAKDGIGKYLDFFIRSIQTRPLTKIVVAEGTAAEALDVKPNLDKIPAMSIDHMVDSQIFNSLSTKSTIKDYINSMVSKTSSFTAPILRIEKIKDEDVLVIKGIAVFKGDKMVGELNGYEGRGLLWVKDHVKSGVVNVDIDEGNAAIEIIDVSCDLSFEIKDKKPIVKIKIGVDGLLASQTCKRNLETMSGVEELEKLLQKEVEKEIKITLKKAQKMNTDIYGFGEEFHKHYNKEWEMMESQWDDLYPALQVNIEVTGKILGAGTISKTVFPEEETEQK
jgi:spore germination protein KC